jgi:hypothetical protein
MKRGRIRRRDRDRPHESIPSQADARPGPPELRRASGVAFIPLGSYAEI